MFNVFVPNVRMVVKVNEASQKSNKVALLGWMSVLLFDLVTSNSSDHGGESNYPSRTAMSGYHDETDNREGGLPHRNALARRTPP